QWTVLALEPMQAVLAVLAVDVEDDQSLAGCYGDVAAEWPGNDPVGIGARTLEPMAAGVWNLAPQREYRPLSPGVDDGGACDRWFVWAWSGRRSGRPTVVAHHPTADSAGGSSSASSSTSSGSSQATVSAGRSGAVTLNGQYSRPVVSDRFFALPLRTRTVSLSSGAQRANLLRSAFSCSHSERSALSTT